jgi:tRNA threonylcarbamoyl adenosine modification protein YjeE
MIGTEEIVVATSEKMHAFGVRLCRSLAAGDLLVLTGPLGAGKTTLARGIGEGLGVRGPVTSPTFVLARTHPSLVGGPPLVHVDAYRLGEPIELDDLDIDFAGSVVLVRPGRRTPAHPDHQARTAPSLTGRPDRVGWTGASRHRFFNRNLRRRGRPRRWNPRRTGRR